MLTQLGLVVKCFHSFHVLGSEDLLQLVMIDTVLLCGNTGHDHYHNQPKGNIIINSGLIVILNLIAIAQEGDRKANQRA